MATCRQLTTEEVQSIRHALRAGRNANRDEALFMLGCCCGARISSLLSLTVGDIVAPNGDVVRHLVFQRRNVKRKQRSHTVELSEYARSILFDYLEHLTDRCAVADAMPLFTTKWGAKSIGRTQAYKIINTAARRAGIGGVIGTHTMRKTFASRYYTLVLEDYRAGRTNEDPLQLTCGALNHADIRSTARYLPHRRDTINSFARRIAYA